MDQERFAPEEKWEILLEALASPIGPADVCSRHGVSLAELRRWLAVAKCSTLSAFAGSTPARGATVPDARDIRPDRRRPVRESRRYRLRKPSTPPLPLENPISDGTRVAPARGEDGGEGRGGGSIRAGHTGMSREEMDAVFSRTSHELREPLRGIRAITRFLLEDFGDSLPEKGVTYLQSLDTLAERMRQQLLGLSEYARCTRSITELRPCALTDVLRRVRSRLRPLVSERNGSVVIDSRLPVVLGDTEALTRVFEHLVRNSMTYCTRESPQVQVVCGEGQVEGDRVTVEVCDNGIGIDPQYHQSVFELFFRLHRYADYPGAGVGLAVVKRIVEALRGKVAIASSSERGTRVALTFLRGAEP